MSSNQRDNILASLRGQHVRIPDLHAIFSAWPQDTSKHMPSIVPAMNKILERNACDEPTAGKLKQEDLAMLTSRWWPYADLQTLLDLAQFVGCIFTVDGVIDQVSGPGEDEIEAFQALHHGTDIFVEQGLDPSNRAKMLTSSSPIVDSFRILSELLCKRYTKEQRKMFLDEARFTMEMLAVQQQLRVNGKIPTLEEYRTYRQGSCCINAMLALVEYGNNLCIPSEIMKSPDMIALKKEAVLANWITNDIVSAKKELASGFVENLVVLCASDGNAQTGVDTAVELLRSSVARFGIAAAKLASHHAGNEALAKDIGKFVQGCRCMCLGSYTWSFASKRYGLQDMERDAATGGIVVVL